MNIGGYVYKAVFISDTHLGSRGCQGVALLSFLKEVKTKKLFLLGDIIDFWALKRSFYWHDTHTEIIRQILKMSKNGVEVVYVTGNHDELLRNVTPLNLGSIKIVDTYDYHTKGKRFLLIHGDQFDHMIHKVKWLYKLGSAAYDILLWFNTRYNIIRKLLGLEYFSISAYLKMKAKSAVNTMDNFKTMVTYFTEHQGYQGVICGHIHKAEITPTNRYMNCGDWVESMTYLVETKDGEFEIYEYSVRK